MNCKAFSFILILIVVSFSNSAFSLSISESSSSDGDYNISWPASVWTPYKNKTRKGELKEVYTPASGAAVIKTYKLAKNSTSFAFSGSKAKSENGVYTYTLKISGKVGKKQKCGPCHGDGSVSVTVDRSDSGSSSSGSSNSSTGSSSSTSSSSSSGSGQPVAFDISGSGGDISVGNYKITWPKSFWNPYKNKTRKGQLKEVFVSDEGGSPVERIYNLNKNSTEYVFSGANEKTATGTYSYTLKISGKAGKKNKCGPCFGDQLITVVFEAPPEDGQGLPNEWLNAFDYDLNDTSLLPDLSNSEFVASTDGNINIDNGVVNYSVAIELPPAVKNLKPNLAFNYSSRISQGLAGLGWNIGGLHAISRCTASVANEGDNARDSNPLYSTSDRLCLDDQKLELVDGSGEENDIEFWSENSEYRTEIDIFAKIQAVGWHVNGPSYFKVYTKDSKILYFGENSFNQNSRAYRTGDPGGVVKNWALSKVEDRYGNTYTIHYDNNSNSGEFYPKHVFFPPSSAVIFEYKDRDDDIAGDRADIIWGYDAGAPYKITKILSKVTTYINAGGDHSNPIKSKPVREYDIKHKRSAVTGRYLVDNIQECGYSEGLIRTCARPLVFDWQEGESGFEDAPANLKYCSGGNVDKADLVVDMNDDGYTDIVSQGVVQAWGTATNCFERSGAEPLDDILPFNIKEQSTQVLQNINGKSLLVHIRENSISKIILVKQQEFSSEVSKDELISRPGPTSALLAADYNNDGLTDFAFGEDIYYKNANDDSSFTKTPNAINLIEAWQPLAYDFNRDGLVDIISAWRSKNANSRLSLDLQSSNDINYAIAFRNSEGAFSLNVQNSSPSVNESHAMRTSPTHDNLSDLIREGSGTYMLLMDANDDGNMDYLFRKGSNGNLKWNIRLGTGLGFTESFDTGISAPGVGKAYVYDYDRDGKDDLIIRSGEEYKLYISTSHQGKIRFVESGVKPFNGRLDNVLGAFLSSGPLSGDYNNDGLNDLYVPATTNSSPELYNARRAQPDLIKSITNGFGKKIKVEFDRLHNEKIDGEAFYSVSPTRTTFPKIQTPRNITVVKSVERSNGIGSTNKTNYRYVGGRQDILGGKFNLFDSIIKSNERSDIVTEKRFISGGEFIGYPFELINRLKNGNLISRKAISYQKHSLNARFISPTSYSEIRYDLTTDNIHEPFSVLYKGYQFDRFGNIESSTNIVGSGFEQGIGFQGSIVKDQISFSHSWHTIENDEQNWLIGFQKESVSSFSDPSTNGGNTKTIRLERTAKPGTLDVDQVTSFEGDQIRHATAYERNSNGEIRGISEGAADRVNPGDFSGFATPRISSKFIFGEDKLYPEISRNALGHENLLDYDKRFGLISKRVDPNNIETIEKFDVLGRSIGQTKADGTNIELLQFYCASSSISCPKDAVYFTAQKIAHNSGGDNLGAPLSLQFFDSLGRVLRVSRFSHAGVVHVDTQYDELGRVLRVSEPFSTQSAQFWQENIEYDALNRLRRYSKADGTEVSINYERENSTLKKTSTTSLSTPTDNRTSKTVELINALGQTVGVTGPDNIPIAYLYDEMGNLRFTIRDNNYLSIITSTYDLWGNKISTRDPDAGEIHFVYDGYGQLRKQIWALGTSEEKSISYEYDRLGRKIKRVDDHPILGQSEYSWVWDTRKKGQLSDVVGNGKSESYFYNSLARISKLSIEIESIGERSFSYEYDNYGRLKSLEYPNKVKIRHDYHAMGMHVQTKDVSSGAHRTLWRSGDVQDDRGNIVLQEYGSGTVSERQYYGESGRLKSINAGRYSAGDVQYLEYEYDSLGNLYSRSSHRVDHLGNSENLEEFFDYDESFRLIDSSLFPNSGSTCGQDFCYDNLGNLTYKSGVGVLEYKRVNNAGIHAITRGNGMDYHYDAYGNMTKRGGDSLSYDTFNKPIRIANTSFSYDANHSLFQQVDEASGVTTWYFGKGLYEEIKSNGKTIKKNYIGDYLVKETEGDFSNEYYLHRDHLGSVEAITDSQGIFTDRMAFDPWGERINEDWSAGDPTLGIPLHYPTQQGYTGHQQLDQLGLVHMGGRVYDPVVSRFLSADIYVQNQHNSQSFNRYSYVMNNPLSNIDPTGYIAVSNSGALFAGASYTRAFNSTQSFGYNTVVPKTHFMGFGSSGSFANFSSLPGQMGSVFSVEQPKNPNPMFIVWSDDGAGDLIEGASDMEADPGWDLKHGIDGGPVMSGRLIVGGSNEGSPEGTDSGIQKELVDAQSKLHGSQFCEVMCGAAGHEGNFDSSLDFAKSIRDINNPHRLGEHDFLPFEGYGVGFHYDTGLGKSYDMQYVLTGWALETQVVGSAGPLYGAYRLLGGGLGGLVTQGQSNVNFTDPANLGGLNFGIFGARRFASFSDFANNACGCGL